MLMDFQIEGGQAVAAEIAAEMRDIPTRYRPVSQIENQAGWMDNRTTYAEIFTIPIMLAIFSSSFIIFSRAMV